MATLYDRGKVCGAGGSEREPDRLAAGELEVKAGGGGPCLASRRSDVDEVVAALVGVRAVLGTRHRADHDARVLDRFSGLVDHVSLEAPESWLGSGARTRGRLRVYVDGIQGGDERGRSGRGRSEWR